jgi:hypothetical protein
MADRSLPLLQPQSNPVLERQLERADRAEADELCATVARRMVGGSQRTRRHSQTYLRLLPFPVFMAGATCTCCAIVHYVLSHPRAREVEVLWYESLAAARSAHPTARVMPDVDRVQPRLQAPRAAERVA